MWGGQSTWTKPDDLSLIPRTPQGERRDPVPTHRHHDKPAHMDMGEREPYSWLVGVKSVQSLWKSLQKHLKKLEVDLPLYPAIPFLSIYPEDPIVLLQRQSFGHVHCCSSQQYLGNGNNLDIHPLMNG